MAQDKQDVINIITNKLIRYYDEGAGWSDVVSAVQAEFTVSDRQSLVFALQKRDFNGAGELLYRAFAAYIRKQAAAEAEAMMTDDSLSLTELLRIL